ncbi:MAG: hypothetical protein M1503_08235 [Thaumarchaeota archaeon]|nr:hypothetical protein [Nitrososphaerota archaeon]MCL5318229.1 hypothetical protein [Nitrososphaerota archaeon]
MTEGAFNAVVGKLRSDPVFLGSCIFNLEAALKGEGFDLDAAELDNVRAFIVSLVVPDFAQLQVAFKEAKNQGVSIKEYFEARRELYLDYSTKFSYDTILEATDQMKKAFSVSLWMHRITFYTGIFLIFAAVYAGFQRLDLLAGALGLGGLADISYHFYKKPVEGVQKSIGNLVQIQSAFLGFINELAYWKGFAGSTDIQKNIQVTKSLRELTEKTMKLIEQYIETEPPTSKQPSTETSE